MIVWINGTFDPEYVGYLLQRFVPVPTGDFQDLPLST